ncbi:MAG TPA: PemK family transcriptional regulator, partial [Ruminococcaceae bacterium]|nr:PemK family transcriptional regulator [Oscillospiraceae bacterium]
MKKTKPFDVRRGGVYMADLGSEEEVVGSEQAGVRPVVATQSNRQNEKSPTVIVA